MYNLLCVEARAWQFETGYLHGLMDFAPCYRKSAGGGRRGNVFALNS